MIITQYTRLRGFSRVFPHSNTSKPSQLLSHHLTPLPPSNRFWTGAAHIGACEYAREQSRDPPSPPA